MPHTRRRHLGSLLKKSLGFSPIVGIFGHRQVGKTTLTSILGEKYLTLDTAEALASASASPETFLSRNKASPLVIDECQLAPPLFPAMKEWVRTRKTPGQLLLTGSVRFSSRKAIRESLTGRIIAWELLPMDLAEQNGQALPDTVPRLLQSAHLGLDLKPKAYFSAAAYEKYLVKGGFPGLFALRDPAILAQRYETQLNTILERDLKLVIETSLSYRTLRTLLVALAKGIGQPLEIAELSREVRISAPTLRKLIAALEAMFVIRLLPSEGDFRKPILFFEDVGEANHLSPFQGQDPRAFLSFVYENVRTQFFYRPQLRAEIFQFRARAGAIVPICFRIGKDILGMIPAESDEQVPHAVSSARSFLKAYPKARVLILSRRGDRDEMILPQVRWLSVGCLL